MGKIRTRILGLEEVEKKQKEEQKERALRKKTARKKDASREKNEDTKSKIIKKTRSKKDKKKHIVGKKYRQSKKNINKKKKYPLKEAIKLLKKIKYAKFDESISIHLNVNESGLKGELELPHSTGKKIRVAIVDDSLIKEIENGKFEFDVLIAHPSYMPKLAKLARFLGPKGLMPNPKAGTISNDPEKVAKKYSKGLVRWKTEAKFKLIHQLVGKASFKDSQIEENIKSFVKSVGEKHIEKAFIATTMSPSISLEIETLL